MKSSNLRQKRGTVLIISIWIMVILALFAFGLSHRAFIELRLTRYYRDKIKADYLAEAAIVRAQFELSKDTNEYDSLNERWSSGLDFQRKEYLFKDINLKDGTYTVSYNLSEEGAGPVVIYGLSDEERRLNINRCVDNKFLRQSLVILLSSIRVDNPDKLVSTLVDWIDQDKKTQEGDSEDSIFKNDVLRCPQELLDVLSFYYYKKETLHREEAEQKAWEIFSKIKDNITVWGDGRININTASRALLKTLFSICLVNNVEGVSESEIDNLLDKIISYRQGPDGQDFSEDDNYFTKLDPGYIIDTIGSYTELLTTGQRNLISFLYANQLITVKSDNFCIEAKGKINNLSRIKKVVVSKATPPKLLYYENE